MDTIVNAIKEWNTDVYKVGDTKEVWGKEETSNTICNDTAEVETRQLDYYKSIGVTTSNYSRAIKNYNESASSWWLRPPIRIVLMVSTTRPLMVTGTAILQIIPMGWLQLSE